jgi:hypothetical protein
VTDNKEPQAYIPQNYPLWTVCEIANDDGREEFWPVRIIGWQIQYFSSGYCEAIPLVLPPTGAAAFTPTSFPGAWEFDSASRLADLKNDQARGVA